MKNNSNIDFLIVGTGLYGATIARMLADAGCKCLMLEKRSHIAGNIYTKRVYGDIDQHVYGPHVFHTSDWRVVEFANKYSNWLNYQQNTIAYDGDKLYHLPFNMNTFYDIFGITSPEQAKEIIDKEIDESGLRDKVPNNLEEQAIKLVGKTIYENLIKNYTEKQWNDDCKNLDLSIITRLPLRFSFNNNYFNDSFQGIPEDGYTAFVERIIGDIPYICDVEFNKDSYDYWKDHVNNKIIYCGAVDEFLDYELGELGWRSLEFVNSTYEWNGYNGQGTSIMNFVGPKENQPATRKVEHMWFKPSQVKIDKYQVAKTSIVTEEIPCDWERGKERYYAINNKDNDDLYEQYVWLLKERMPNIWLGGRLGKYKYFDMDDTILEAMNDAFLITK